MSYTHIPEVNPVDVSDALLWAFDPFEASKRVGVNERASNFVFSSILRMHNAMFVYLDEKYCIVYQQGTLDRLCAVESVEVFLWR